MKKLLAICFLFFSMLAAEAGGVVGKVTNSNGSGRSGVTVLVKLSYQKIQTTTDKNGRFVIICPEGDSGTRAKVYVGGRYVTTVTIPAKGYATVNVDYSK